jgi:hypothetical protein
MLKIRNSIIKTILLFSVLFHLGNSTSAQNVEIMGDTIEISMNGHNGGEIQWQFSNDNSNWEDIAGANNQILSYKISETGQFRAKVTDGRCSYFSETNSIEAFDFNLYDANGIPRLSKESEFIILIPDIQYYNIIVGNNKYLENIISFILGFNNYGFKTKAVLQVGDITELNTIAEWERARKIFSKLDNKIDYIFCTGNHDYGTTGSANNRDTYFSNYFDYITSKSYKSSFEENKFENSHFQIEIQNQAFQIITLEFAPRDKVVNWAINKIKENPSQIGILMDHAFLAPNKERYNFRKYKNGQGPGPYAYTIATLDKINDGEEIWHKVIYPNDQVRFVFSGHNLIPGNDYNILSENQYNNQVFQMVYNKQDSPFGGEGWIKIIEFSENRIATFKTYSTLLKKWDENSPSVNFSY